VPASFFKCINYQGNGVVAKRVIVNFIYDRLSNSFVTLTGLGDNGDEGTNVNSDANAGANANLGENGPPLDLAGDELEAFRV
jgi:hypothetical protein